LTDFPVVRIALDAGQVFGAKWVIRAWDWLWIGVSSAIYAALLGGRFRAQAGWRVLAGVKEQGASIPLGKAKEPGRCFRLNGSLALKPL